MLPIKNKSKGISRTLSLAIMIYLSAMGTQSVWAATDILSNIDMTSNWGAKQWSGTSITILPAGGADAITVKRTTAGLGTFGWDTPSTQNEVLTFNINNINIETIATGASIDANTVLGLYNAGSQIDASKTNFDIKINYQTPAVSLAVPVAYAVLAGSSVNAGITGSTANRADTTVFSDIIVNNLTINQTVTDNYLGKYGGHYSLNSGIRAIQGAYADSGAGGAGRVIVNGNLDMTLTGGRQEGIYVSGEGSAAGSVTSTVILNGDSKITLLNGEGTDNSAIKIGKSRDIGTGRGILESHGSMTINMYDVDGKTGTNTDTAAIKLAVSGSTLKADYDTSSTKVITKNGNVLNVGYNDWGTQVPSNNITASFRNADFTTQSKTHSMLQVFKNQGAVNLSFTGNGTKLNMRQDQSWVLNVDTSDTTGYNNKVAFSLKNGGLMTGLINQSGNGSINAILDTGATWKLNKNTTGKTATFTDLTMTNSAVVDASADDFTLKGNVKNTSGIINLDTGVARTEASDFRVLTINGDYVGGSTAPASAKDYPAGNGAIVVGTVWNNENSSKTDNVHITGTATGYTQVKTASNILGDVTRSSIDKQSENVITVDNHTLGANAFYGFANTAGAGQALLVQKDANNYVWQINGFTVDPVRPDTGGEVMIPRINSEMGFAVIDTLHQRVGEQQSLNLDSVTAEKLVNYNKTVGNNTYKNDIQKDDDDNQVWARLIGRQTKEDGNNRFSYTNNMWGVQIGRDLKVRYDVTDGMVKKRTHQGVMFTYGRSNVSFRDRNYVLFNTQSGAYESSVQNTGSANVDMLALGGYYTQYKADGSYLDLVGNWMHFNNRYSTINGDSYGNNAWGLSLSAEAGKPKFLKNNWKLEPQAQLIWQYLHSSSYNDAVTFVDPGNHNALRGRVGFRLSHQKDEKGSSVFYFTGNIIHDFTGYQSITIGADQIKENWSRTWWSLGIGGQRLVKENLYLYGDVRYEHSFGGGRSSWVGTGGLRYQF